MKPSTTGETVWGPVAWDGTVADLERCVKDLLAAGTPPDAVVTVSFTSYRIRMVRARPAPPLRPSAPPPPGSGFVFDQVPPPTTQERVRRQRAGHRASRGLP